MSDLDKFTARADKAEKEIVKLAAELEALKTAGASKAAAAAGDGGLLCPWPRRYPSGEISGENG